MKKLVMIGVAATAAALSACGGEQQQQEPEAKLDTLEQKVSYIVGYNMAQQAKSNNFEVDAAAMNLAVEDVISGKESRLSDEEGKATMQAFQAQQQARQEEEMNKLAEENKQEGDKFLEENRQKEDVQVTDSGLQYKVLTEGEGESPTAEDSVTVHYTGRLLDGTEFDSSKDRGPATFPVTGVIPGWVEALQLMQVGDKWELYIPPDLAYGPGGTSGPIGPNETLIFEVELLDVTTPEEKAAEKEQNNGGDTAGESEQ